MNGIFKLGWVNVKSALVYGLLSAILAIGMYMLSVGSVFSLDFHELINAGVFGFLGVIISLVKNLLTTNSGNFLGAVEVIPNKQ